MQLDFELASKQQYCTSSRIPQPRHKQIWLQHNIIQTFAFYTILSYQQNNRESWPRKLKSRLLQLHFLLIQKVKSQWDLCQLTTECCVKFLVHSPTNTVSRMWRKLWWSQHMTWIWIYIDWYLQRTSTSHDNPLHAWSLVPFACNLWFKLAQNHRTTS